MAVGGLVSDLVSERKLQEIARTIGGVLACAISLAPAAADREKPRPLKPGARLPVGKGARGVGGSCLGLQKPKDFLEFRVVG
jgi:hypothetical protein